VDWQLNATYSTMLACIRVSYNNQILVARFYPVGHAVCLVVAGLVHIERLASGVLHIDSGSTLLQSISLDSRGYIECVLRC
jgi:hypothetical protein